MTGARMWSSAVFRPTCAAPVVTPSFTPSFTRRRGTPSPWRRSRARRSSRRSNDPRAARGDEPPRATLPRRGGERKPGRFAVDPRRRLPLAERGQGCRPRVQEARSELGKRSVSRWGEGRRRPIEREEPLARPARFGTKARKQSGGHEMPSEPPVPRRLEFENEGPRRRDRRKRALARGSMKDEIAPQGVEVRVLGELLLGRVARRIERRNEGEVRAQLPRGE